MSGPALSVVVIGRNEGARLVRCLESVKAMTPALDPFEVIYVDSASDDDSVIRATELGARVVEIKGGRLSAARARNAGWQIASAPLILFLDGDTILHPDFVSKTLAEFQDPKVMVVWGHRREVHPEASIYNRVLDLNWICPPGLAEFCGGDAVMRRAALEQAGGFNPDLIAGEEPDLCLRIRAAGGLIMHIDAPMTGHDFAMVSWQQYWKHSFRAGHAYAEVAAMYKNTDDPFWSDASRSNVVRVRAYILGVSFVILASLLAHSWIFVLAAFFCFSAILLRTAIKAKSKSSSVVTLLLFAVHSHFQQIPVFLGQLRYWRNVRRNWRSNLIEYKKSG
jgi:cellulose synthase/poly-beta-1,6-N-acetylglucosamine synthase-like glycosyltransferase